MHLVFLNQYYPPDAAPTGVMLEALVEHLATQGHEVTVLCAEGGYAGGGEHRTSNGTLVAAVCDRRSECDAAAILHSFGSDASGAPLQSRPRIIRIQATRFGRGTFAGKLMDYLSYYLGVAWKLWVLRPRPARIIALTTPPYLSVLARLMSKGCGADHAHWVMDLYPDVMVAHGMLPEGGWKHRVLADLARWGFGGARCAAVLTLGPDMAQRVEGLKSEGGRSGEGTEPNRRAAVSWIPLWGEGSRPDVILDRPAASDDPVSALRRARGWKDDELVVMYSGNMGLGHRFGEILEVIGQETSGRKVENEAAVYDRRGEYEENDPPGGGQAAPDGVGRLRKGKPTRWVFFGGGKRRGEIEAFVRAHPAAAVELHDYAPAEILPIHLASADVHLASLDPAWTGTMVPSKLQGIFEVGRPVIFIGSAESSIGRWVAESGGGWRVQPGDVAGLAAVLDQARDHGIRRQRGLAARAFAAAHFQKSANLARVAEVLLRP